MLQVGQILQQRYQLKTKLSRSTGRQTWLAADLKTPAKPHVILKLLSFGGDIDWNDLKLFEREGKILQQLNHPYIPQYRDYFTIDERYLWFGLVQEYIAGQSLKELLEQGKRFNLPEIEDIARQILDILLYLHELTPRVIHRDIKPSNLIWGKDEKIYLIDFGAVQDKAVTEGATFTVVGTYGYAPMEQFGGRAVPASDLYSLGATLIHLLTGTPPGDLPTKDLKIQFQNQISLTAAEYNHSNKSNNLIRWIEKLTEPALEKRFSSAKIAKE
ncbi:MAG: serine/threonine protein kinase, partial [Cyanobacteria bacterium J083]